MASNYSNERAERRKANRGVNRTQRSWSNYEGDTPNRSWVGSDMYRDSERWGGRSSSPFPDMGPSSKSADSESETVVPGESAWEKLQRETEEKRRKRKKEKSQWQKLQEETALRRGIKSMRGSTGVATPIYGSDYAKA